MGGDPIPGPHDILRTWYELPTLKGREKREAIAKLEKWLEKAERSTMGRVKSRSIHGSAGNLPR